MSVQIIPSLLAADLANLERECTAVINAGAKTVHFDVMDGQFVNNISFGIPVLASLYKALPNVVYDVHLMIKDPLKYVEHFAKAGATWLTFHCEADSEPEKTIKEIKAHGMLAGVSIKPSTPVQAVFPLLDKVDLVLVMGVEPGHGGQAFIPSTVKKIADLCKEAKAYDIQRLRLSVDGGINKQTAGLCAAAGATMLVAGSSVFAENDYAKAMAELENATS